MEKDFLSYFIKVLLPQFDWILSEMEKSGGCFDLPAPLIENLVNFKVKESKGTVSIDHAGFKKIGSY